MAPTASDLLGAIAGLSTAAQVCHPLTMTMSLEDFHAALVRPDLRATLGLPLTDLEAQQVAGDPASTQSWHAYWLSIQPSPAAAPPPPPAYAVSAPYAPPGSESAPDADSQPTIPIHDTVPAAPADQMFAAPAGQAYAATQPYPGYGAAPGYPGHLPGPDGQPVKKKRVGLWVTLSVLGALFLIAAIVVVFAFTTARHWTKTDVPEQPETFHSEEFETGRYDVAMDSTNPCTVNQDWTDCTDLMAATYTASCVGVELTEAATALCTEYSGAIDEMRAQDGDGYYVATLGTYGTLSRTPEIDTRQVSNDDYRPAETHEAVCYLGFLGECE